MQNPILFQTPGSLPVSGHLPGMASWPDQVTLTRVRLRTTRGFAGGDVTLALEVAGVLTGDALTLPAGQTESVMLLSVVVPAGQLVRWQCAFSGLAADAPAGVDAVLDWEPYLTVPPPMMELVWQNGAERLSLFRYNMGDGLFTDISGGLAAGRAAVDTAAGISFYLNGVEVLRCRAAGAAAVEWVEGGFPPSSSPWLAFEVNGVPWLVLGMGGAYAGFIAETPAWPVAAVYFDLLTARVTADGFYAESIGEPLT